MSTFNELIDFTRSTTGTYLDSVVYSDELVTNGTFDNNIDGWTTGSNVTSSYYSGTAQLALGGALTWTYTNWFSQNVFETGKLYFVTFDATYVSGGSLQAGYGYDLEVTASSSGTYSFIVNPDIGAGSLAQREQLTFGGASGAVWRIDNVSVKEVIGGQVSGTPLLRTAAINEPRLEYDAQGNALGLLIEEARTNLLAYSEEFGNWTGQNVSISSNQTAAPDGTNTADKVEEQNTNNTFHFVTRSLWESSAGVKTFSAYVKADERSFAGLTLRVNGGSDRLAVLFNLTSGTVSDTLTAGSPTQTSSSIQDVGNGWYRCSISAYHSAGNVIALLSPHDDGTSSTINLDYAGIVGHGIYIWGAQAEAGAFPTSYIPTTGSAVTRAKDVASASSFKYHQNSTQGTLYVAFTPNVDSSNFLRVAEFGYSNLRFSIQIVNGAIRHYTRNAANNTNNVIGTPYLYTLNSTQKTAFTVSAGYAAQSTNGTNAQSETDVLGLNESNVGFYIGRSGHLAQLNGHIKQIQYYPKRLSNAQLQALTS